MRICVEYTECAFTKLWSYFYQVISVHSPLGVDPGLSVPNCQAFTQVLGYTSFAEIRIWIRITHLRSMWIWFWIQGFDDQKLQKLQLKKSIFF
jgi:hypothetical protein